MEYNEDTTEEIFRDVVKIDIWHNILWSRYKGAVFSEVYTIAKLKGIVFSFYQIAETEGRRNDLGQLDLSYHRYPYTLVFPGSYESVPVLRRCLALARYTLESASDMIILAGYSEPEYWIQLIIARFQKKAIGVFCDSTGLEWPRTGVLSNIKWIFKRTFFKKCDVIFCYGTRAKAYIQSFGVQHSKIVERVQAAALPPEYSKEFVLEERLQKAPASDRPRFLYVGRLSEEKDLVTLLQAFALLVKDIPAARLVLVGAGPTENELRSLVGVLAIGPNVEFLGAKSDAALYQQYLTATCLILPSRREPWGLVVNEALSYGCPVIVSDRCGCVPELVVDRRTGFAFVCGDIVDLANKMRQAVDVFQHILQTATACLAQMEPFSAANAATQIVDGCLERIPRARQAVQEVTNSL